MKDQQFEPENQIHWRMIRKEIPENCHQLFLPLYLMHPAAIKLRSYGVFMSGFSEAGSGFRITRYADFHVVIFTMGGEAVFRTGNGKETRVQPGMATLIPAGVEHDYYPTSKDPWKFFWFHLIDAPIWNFLCSMKELVTGSFGSAELLEQAMKGFVAEISSLCTDQENSKIPYFYVDSPQLRKSMTEFNLPVRNDMTEDSEIAELYAELIWRHLLRELQKLTGVTENALAESKEFDHLWEEIVQKPELSWTLPKMAAKMNMSISTFLRRVRQIYNRTPMDVVTHIRMCKAAQLLQETQLPVMTIAAKVGYVSTSNFVTVFRRNFKYTPLCYRKRNNSGG